MHASRKNQSVLDLAKKLLVNIDCSEKISDDRYFSCGKVKVVFTEFGRYREAEGKPLSRFGYRFAVENIGRPHLAVINYPDDKQRFMVVNDGTSYDLSTGIHTGLSHPLSKRIQTIHQVFWPRWKDCSIVFMTWGYNEPAAVQSIDIYELSDLPALELMNNRCGRQLGIQYEDPCGIGASEGAINFDEWLDRVVTYAKYTGQNLLSYPICWYHGPQFPSAHEPSDVFNMTVARDRRQYVAWTTDPPDWTAKLLKRFEEEGLEFQAVLTLLRLGSLMKQMNTDLPAIQAGADTINNMLWCDKVQEGTNDWTPIYNVQNYDNLIEHCQAGNELWNYSKWAYGEKSKLPYHSGPIFNPLHPTVQQALIDFIQEIGHRYGSYPSFKGIAITMWMPTLIWFGSIHAGYDDYTVGLFEKETQVKVPVEKNTPNRFSKRYEFLTFNCKPLWVQWRCRKIYELICRLRDVLIAERPDLKLTLNLWSEPLIPLLYGSGQPQQQIFSRPNGKEVCREAGLDIELFQDEHNIELDLQTEGGGRDRTCSNQENAPLECFHMFRDHDYLDQPTLDSVHQQRTPGMFIFNAWHEAWGDHKWFRAESKDSNLAQVSSVYGKKAEGVFRVNSSYPKDGFWWDSQLRITHAFPPEIHFMEHYAHAVAELDACRITRGGLFLDKSHSDQLRTFACAYRALPAEKFKTVGESTDPVAVRTLVCDGKRYFYLVNREYYTINVTIVFSALPAHMIDLATGRHVDPISQSQIALGPYELRSFCIDPKIELESFTTALPPGMAETFLRQAKDSIAAFDYVRKTGMYIPGMDQMASLIRSAAESHRFAQLRRALGSYPVCKCQQCVPIS